ncbi:GntR family transcriptional regulator [Sphingomonas corticis]|uniref:GntR family transcriptional regulator n=1 Tax=Sphingomonas corticis TaxID=2722791 RepID=A0ABX1CRL4_9SPHN|nr:GntR family transcriptional regulator [Sphingomonas corticis]NJR80593.1 GntR family transcriptional regulator [Sphingomonas corticis]
MKTTPAIRGGRRRSATLQLRTNARPAPEQPVLLHERAAQTIRNMIIEGEILPGSRMPEVELCEMLGISRTPLREALKVLATEGLLVLTPQRGAMVTEPDLEQLDATVEAVAHVEAATARIACRAASEGELQAMAGLHEQMIAASGAGDSKRYFRLNQEFHDAIVTASHNPVLGALHGRANAHLKRLRYERMSEDPDQGRTTFIAEHAAIVAALLARDADASHDAVLAHFASVANFVGVRSRQDDPESKTDLASGDRT